MIENRNHTITPDSKVGQILDKFPELEEVLMSMSPAFGKLRNPVLRRTVARVATLKQVARVGDIPLGRLVNDLRRVVGQEETAIGDNGEGGDGMPNWLDESKICKSLDARPIIDSGNHPMGQVLGNLKEMPANGIFELITPFEPVPLMDKAADRGFAAWSRRVDTNLFKTYFHKK